MNSLLVWVILNIGCLRLDPSGLGYIWKRIKLAFNGLGYDCGRNMFTFFDRFVSKSVKLLIASVNTFLVLGWIHTILEPVETGVTQTRPNLYHLRFVTGHTQISDKPVQIYTRPDPVLCQTRTKTDLYASMHQTYIR